MRRASIKRGTKRSQGGWRDARSIVQHWRDAHCTALAVQARGPGSNPQDSGKKPGTATCACNSGQWKAETAGSPGLGDGQLGSGFSVSGSKAESDRAGYTTPFSGLHTICIGFHNCMHVHSPHILCINHNSKEENGNKSRSRYEGWMSNHSKTTKGHTQEEDVRLL